MPRRFCALAVKLQSAIEEEAGSKESGYQEAGVCRFGNWIGGIEGSRRVFAHRVEAFEIVQAAIFESIIGPTAP
jgi:hypothetical protein